jgi:hypothetical protein
LHKLGCCKIADNDIRDFAEFIYHLKFEMQQPNFTPTLNKELKKKRIGNSQSSFSYLELT